MKKKTETQNADTPDVANNNNSQTKNYYEVLDVPINATPEDIKKAYHKKALETHTDKNPKLGSEPFKKVNEAYQTLIDPNLREAYNQQLLMNTNTQPTMNQASNDDLTHSNRFTANKDQLIDFLDESPYSDPKEFIIDVIKTGIQIPIVFIGVMIGAAAGSIAGILRMNSSMAEQHLAEIISTPLIFATVEVERGIAIPVKLATTGYSLFCNQSVAKNPEMPNTETLGPR